MKGKWWIGLGGLLLLGCARQGLVKLGEGHYQTTCTSSQSRRDAEQTVAVTAYTQCQKKAEELCGGPYDLKQLRREWITGSTGWISRERYDIVCRPEAPMAPPSKPAALSEPAPQADPSQPNWDEESTVAAAGAPSE